MKPKPKYSTMSDECKCLDKHRLYDWYLLPTAYIEAHLESVFEIEAGLGKRAEIFSNDDGKVDYIYEFGKCKKPSFLTAYRSK